MSAPKRRLVITERARSELRAIRRYTVRQWGPEQFAVYRARLTAAMERLTEYPTLGRAAPHIAADVAFFPVEQHVISFRFDDRTLTVLAIVHGRMDASRLGPL
jgi:toxin ParE1/3/4